LCCTVFWEQVHAIEQFKKADNIDLIILDSVMPKMNGREAYNEIHKIKPDIKVIFTSGYTRDVFLDKGIEDKEFNFLQKAYLASYPPTEGKGSAGRQAGLTLIGM